MTIDLTEVVWLEESEECTLGELAVRSRLAPGEIMELVECGALAVNETNVGEPRFPGHALPVARTAARLRDDFEVDVRGVALALALLRRIDVLESQLRALTPRTP